MAGTSHNACFKNVVANWCISEPDKGFQVVASVLACAFLCSQQDCTTVDVLPEVVGIICQLSKRKATCMEKKEVFRCPGSRIYQRKVNIDHNTSF
jgi:hypothetical protein